MPLVYDDQPPPRKAAPRVPGNVNLHNRPRVQNADGSFSTVRSMSFGTDQGEVLVPTISDDGRTLSEDEAIAQYRKTGKHLGIFSTPDEATAYAESLHNDQAREYAQPKKGRLVYDDEATPQAAAAPARSTFSSPYGGYTAEVRNAGTAEQRGQQSAAMRGQARDFATSIPAGINKGVTMLAGLPVDTVTSAVDLLGMAYGASRSALSGQPAGEFYTPIDRAGQFGTGEYISRKLDQGVTAVGGSPVTVNPNDTPAGRIGFSVGASIPGAVGARQLAGAAAGGGASGVVAEAGGDPGAQALAGLVGGRVGERTSPVKRTETAQAGTFGRDSASAAAAVPELARVSPELQAPLTKAFQRGERETVERVVRAETLPVPIRMMEGQARGDSTLMADEFNLRSTDKEVAQRFDEQNQALIDNLDEIRRQVSPNVVAADHIQNGQSLIDAYKAYDAPQRERITAMYKALEDANGGQLPINAAGFVKAADAALGKKLKTRYLPSEIRGDIEDLRAAGGMMTFEQLENLRTNLAAASRKADAARDGNAAAAIGEVRRALETAPLEVPPELKQLADQARAAARARFEALDADPAYRAAVDDDTPAGELSAMADDFVKKYVVNGKAANLKRMQDTLAGDPIAGETIAAAALNYVKSKSGVNSYTNEGNFSQAGYNRALGELMPKLEALVPRETGELLAQLGTVAQDLQRQRKGGAFNNSGTFSAAVRESLKNKAEGALNTLTPGVELGTFVRKKRSEARERKRIRRALDPQQYLTQDSGEE